jgi:hypothetical protein
MRSGPLNGAESFRSGANWYVEGETTEVFVHDGRAYVMGWWRPALGFGQGSLFFFPGMILLFFSITGRKPGKGATKT